MKDNTTDEQHDVLELLHAVAVVREAVCALPRNTPASAIAQCAFLAARGQETAAVPTSAILAAALGTLMYALRVDAAMAVN